jgi:C4-dicarboxylate-specific signal transduction histidine kinase
MMAVLALCAVLTGIIFYTDSTFIVSPAISVMYILPLLILANCRWKALVLPWAGLCLTLTLAAYLIGLPWSLGTLPTANLLIGVMAITVTVHQLIRSERMSKALASDEKRYRDVFNNVATAIWEHDLRPMQETIAHLRALGIRDIRSHLAHNPQIVADTRNKVRIIDVNETGLTLMKVATKDQFFQYLGEFLTDDDTSFEACMVAVSEGRSHFQNRCQLRTATGELIDIIVAFSLGSGEPLDRVAASILNVTEEVRLSKLIAENRGHMARVEQAAALGQMSASIAHELEQPLTAIQTSLAAAMRWARRGTSSRDEVQASLEIVSQATHRARDVIQRVRSLVGKAETQTKPLALDDFLLDATLLLQGEIAGHGVRLTRCLQAPCLVQADEVLLQQVVTNVVRNALQAMAAIPQADRVLTIETEIVGDMASIRVRDTGPGWSPDILAAAFQAFRSTKAGGMGLGLSICRTIIEAHHGQIRIANAEGGGALVELRLPLRAVASGAGAGAEASHAMALDRYDP